MREIDRDDFTGNPSYQALANEFIEPPVRIKYQPVIVDGKRLGVYEIGDIPGGELMEVFTAPLRICVGNDLSGRRFGVQYSLFAKNLRAPACGKLRLLF